jgi:hypothetical protein
VIKFAALALPFVFGAFSTQAEPGWDRFVSQTGFSVEHPLGWQDSRIDHTVHGKQLIWQTDEFPGFSLRYLKPDADHAGIPYFPGQFSIYEMEIERSITLQDELKFTSSLRKKIDKVYNMALNSKSPNSCRQVTVIQSAGMAGPYGQSKASKPWLENNTDIICPIGNRQFRFSLNYANNDSRADAFNKVLIEMTKSFRLIPVKHKGRYCALGQI